uniref:Uncharacterized protein n=1 Tax=Syphacia muris TaxID=451379 RepID=A0A0N5AD80_9BILA
MNPEYVQVIPTASSYSASFISVDDRRNCEERLGSSISEIGRERTVPDERNENLEEKLYLLLLDEVLLPMLIYDYNQFFAFVSHSIYSLSRL